MSTSSTERDSRTTRAALATLAVLNTVSSWAGALGLVVGFLSLDTTLTSRLPWGSAAFGGFALALVVAVPNTILAVLAVRGDHRAGSTAIGVGVLLVGWILVQLGFIRELSFFHPLYVALGLVLVWLGARLVRLTTGVAGRTLLHEAGDCLIDLPVFVTSPLYRRWHVRWGATDTEVRADMDGDELLPRASYVATRAITIDAPIERVWPWLVQVGCLRAGFYSDDLLDNLGRPSSRTVQADLQQLHVGLFVPMSPTPTESTSFRVASYAAPCRLLWSKPDSTWAWQLSATDSGGTRLVTRVRATHPWHRPVAGLLSLVILELGDFAMMRRMLRGIRDRAETADPAIIAA